MQHASTHDNVLTLFFFPPDTWIHLKRKKNVMLYNFFTNSQVTEMHFVHPLQRFPFEFHSN